MKHKKHVLRLFAVIAILAFVFITCKGDGGGSENGGIVVESIKVTTLPTKVLYNIGETMNRTGMVVTAYYSDGTSGVVTNYTMSGFDSATAGQKTITVTFSGKNDTFQVTVGLPGSDTIGIIVGHPDESIEININGTDFSNELYDIIEVTVEGEFDYFYWLIDGTFITDGPSNKFTTYADRWNIGTYTLTVICWKGLPWELSVPYSNEVIFNIY